MGYIRGEGTILVVTGLDGTGDSTIGQVISIDKSGSDVAAVEITHLTSPQHQYRNSMLHEGGEISVTILYDSANASQQDLRDATLTPQEDLYGVSINFTDGSKFTFDGFPQSWDVNGLEVEGNATATCKFKVADDDEFTSDAT